MSCLFTLFAVLKGSADFCLFALQSACKHVLRGHSSTVRCMRVIDGRPIAVSGSRDATLRVWNIETGTAMHQLVGHSHSVRCIEVSGNKVVSGSYDATCRVSCLDLSGVASRLTLGSALCSSGMSTRASASSSTAVTFTRSTPSPSMAFAWSLAVSTRPCAFGPPRLGEPSPCFPLITSSATC